MSIEKKIECVDLTKISKKIEWTYKGEFDLYLEARILEHHEDELKIGLCGPWPKDITKRKYDRKNNTYEIYVKKPDPNEIRIAILRCNEMYVPDTLEKVLVYGVKKK